MLNITSTLTIYYEQGPKFLIINKKVLEDRTVLNWQSFGSRKKRIGF